MQPLQSTGRIFYGAGIAGMGFLQFVYAGFRPVFLPIPPEATQHVNFLVYLTGGVLMFMGISIAVGWKVKAISLLLALLLLSFFLFGHLPHRLANNPGSLGAWTNALKVLALSGSAFIILSLPPLRNSSKLAGSIEKRGWYGKYFLALMLVIFGIDHFLYVDFVRSLVPRWIPNDLFWTYFSAIALIGAGLAIFLDFKPAIISLLLGTMLFLWLIVLHIPRALAASASDHGNEWTSVFQCLAFSGIAVLYPLAVRKKDLHNQSGHE